MRFFLAYIIFLNLYCTLYAENLVRDFALYKLNEGNKKAPTLLLVGGIHGNEPGAYYASDFFLRHYKITKGSVWVVPVANPHGMFANMRGVYGDMNRKFASLPQNDPDYQSIQKIKELLADPQIDISIHLHDGSGYWRPTYISDLLNPRRWGNCSVIDQKELQGAQYGSLESYVSQMVADINTRLIQPIHRYHANNTHTKAKNDTEQLKALTFYSLSLGKPALTNEASKEIDIPTRVYYHLIAIESLLGQLGIEFERNFELEVNSIKELIAPSSFDINIANLITLPLNSLRSHITYFPLPKNTSLKTIPIQSQSHLFGLLSLNQTQTQVALKYGSNTLSTLTPEYRTFDTSLKNVNILINGTKHTFPIGSLIYIREDESIEFEASDDYRVNVIGFVLPHQIGLPDESGAKIYKKDLLPRYSLDNAAKTFRAEFYRGDAFSGMITFSFASPKPKQDSQFFAVKYIPATTEQQSKLPQIASKDTPSKITNTPKDSQNTTPKNIPQTYFITSSKGVNIRAQGDINAQILTKLSQGKAVNLIESKGKWSKILYPPHNKEGYVITSALGQNPPNTETSSQVNTLVENSHTQDKRDSQPLESSPHSQKITQETGEIRETKTAQKTNTPNAEVKVQVALVRLSPSLNAPVVAKAPLGRKMQILSFEGDNKEWAKIYYIFEGKNGMREINGYVAKHLLTSLER